MMCQKCNKNEVTFHYTQNINGKVTEMYLCENCSKQSKTSNFDFDLPFSISDIFSSLSGYSSKSEIHKQTICQSCNSSYNRFKQTGKIGCSECYQTFKSQIIPIIQSIHGDTEHVGKIPKNIEIKLKIKNEIKTLRSELSKSIEIEDYEKAAQIRDQIRELEKNMNNE